MSEEKEEDNIVRFQRASVLPKQSPRRSFCYCLQVEVDSFYRTVHCRSCGRTIDPFDHLVALANREAQYIAQADSKAKEAARLQEEKDQPKDVIGYVVSGPKREQFRIYERSEEAHRHASYLDCMDSYKDGPIPAKKHSVWEVRVVHMKKD
jgi:hypothetical protein